MLPLKSMPFDDTTRSSGRSKTDFTSVLDDLMRDCPDMEILRDAILQKAGTLKTYRFDSDYSGNIGDLTSADRTRFEQAVAVSKDKFKRLTTLCNGSPESREEIINWAELLRSTLANSTSQFFVTNAPFIDFTVEHYVARIKQNGRRRKPDDQEQPQLRATPTEGWVMVGLGIVVFLASWLSFNPIGMVVGLGAILGGLAKT